MFLVEQQDHGLHKALDLKLIEKCLPALDRGEKVQFMEETRNVNRSVGAMRGSKAWGGRKPVSRMPSGWKMVSRV